MYEYFIRNSIDLSSLSSSQLFALIDVFGISSTDISEFISELLSLSKDSALLSITNAIEWTNLSIYLLLLLIVILFLVDILF